MLTDPQRPPSIEFGSCPTAQTLREFLADELPNDEEDRLAQHLNACASCRRQLDLDPDGENSSEISPQWLKRAAAETPGGPPTELRQRLYRLAGAESVVSTIVELKDGQPVEAAGNAATSGWPSSERMVLPRKVGRFEIQQKLGEGGFGLVLLAYDTVLKRQVALKLPRAPALLDPTQRARFLREAQAAAGLHHPNILPVFEAGEADGLCYLAVAWCRGPDLACWLAEQTGPVAPRMAAAIVGSLAEGADHAHRSGVLHRDIKPGNVLLDPASTSAELPFTPKLADFGLAKLAEADGHATLSGTLMGTPRYMAPEQAAARRREIGPASDVYSLGAVLYELLTGKPPIVGGDNADTLRRVLTEDPPPPSARAPDVPRDLDAICMKCLDKAPGRRYASAASLAADLARFTRGEPTLARPLGRLIQGLRWCRRRPVAACLAGLLLMMAVVAPLVAVRESLLAASEFDARQDAERANLGETAARRKAERAAAREQAARKDAEGKSKELALQAKELISQAKVLKEQKGELRRQIYRASMNLVEQAWNDDNLPRLIELLEQHRPAPGDDDLRGFEWYHWWRRSHDYAWKHSPDKSAPWQPEFSPDGRWLAVPDREYGMKLLNARTRAVERAFDGACSAVAFSPDGALLARNRAPMAMAPTPGIAVVIVDVASGEPKFTVEGADAMCLEFSSDGKTLFLGGFKSISRWDFTGDEPPRTLVDATNTTNLNLEFGFRLLARSTAIATYRAQKVRIYDSNTGELQHELDQSTSGVPHGAIAFAPGSDILAYPVSDPARNSRTIHFWDYSTGKELPTSGIAPTNVLSSIAWSKDGRVLATGVGREIQFRNSADLALLDTFKGHLTEPQSIVFSRDGQMWASGSGSELLIWDRAAPRAYQRIEAHADGANVSAAADGELVVSAGGDATAKMWEASTGKLLATHQVGHKHENVGAVSRHGELVAIGDRSGKITFLRPAAPNERLEVKSDGAYIKSVAMSPDGKLLASGAQAIEQDNLTLWRPDSSELPRALPGHPQMFRNGAHQPVFTHKTRRAGVLALTFSPDGQILASAAEDYRIRLWDVPTGRLLHELIEHQAWVWGVAFSPDGKLLASASDDGTIKLWDPQTGACAAVLNAHFAGAKCVAFAQDGKTLASGHNDKTVRLWNVETCELCSTFKEPTSGVNSIAFAAGGKVLVASGYDGVLHFWRTAVAEK